MKYEYIISSVHVLLWSCVEGYIIQKLLPADMNTTSNCSFAPTGTRFNIDECRNRTVGCPFFPKVPYDECERYCGSSYGHYEATDIWGALTTWVIPLFGLVANMHFAKSTLYGLGTCCPWMPDITKNRPSQWLISQLPKHFVLSVQLANPIGTIWCLADKLDLSQQLWNHCKLIEKNRCLHLENDRYCNPRRDTANVCNVLEDFGHEGFEERVNRLVELLTMYREVELNGKIVSVANAVYKEVNVASRNLALAHIRDTLHATFAILVYVGNAIAALLISITSSGLDYALPHTIALRELCFFLFAQVILSAAAGRWAQQWMPQDIMRTFAKKILAVETAIAHDIERATAKDGAIAQEGAQFCSLWENLARDEIALWDGGSYVFRPQKSRHLCNVETHSRDEFSRKNDRRWFLLVMAWVMVLLAFFVSFAISYWTPTTGIGGRGLAEISYITVWIANFLIEEVLVWRIDPRRRKFLFMLIWLKDGTLSLFALLIFFLPFIGEPFPAQ
jgi:hypothetical protein